MKAPTQDELKAKLRRVLGKRLRQVFKFSGLRTIAKNLQPYCGNCGAEDNLEVDHDPPVSPVEYNVTEPLEYFKRMFCMEDNGDIIIGRLNVLCSDCHSVKSEGQMAQRARYKTGPYSPEAKLKAANTRAKLKAANTRAKRKARKAKRGRRR